MLKGAALAAGALTAAPGTALAATPTAKPKAVGPYVNPLVPHRADPHITRQPAPAA
ncbi:hypothetical protein [Streptomyces sp. NPDC000851]